MKIKLNFDEVIFLESRKTPQLLEAKIFLYFITDIMKKFYLSSQNY